MITPKLIDTINADVKKALEEVAKKHNVTIRLGGTKYGSADYTTQLKVAMPEAEEVKGEESRQYAKFYDLPESVVGMEFTMGRDKFKVVRIDPAKPKNPIIIKKVGATDNKTYKMSDVSLKAHAKTQIANLK